MSQIFVTVVELVCKINIKKSSNSIQPICRAENIISPSRHHDETSLFLSWEYFDFILCLSWKKNRTTSTIEPNIIIYFYYPIFVLVYLPFQKAQWAFCHSVFSRCYLFWFLVNACEVVSVILRHLSQTSQLNLMDCLPEQYINIIGIILTKLLAKIPIYHVFSILAKNDFLMYWILLNIIWNTGRFIVSNLIKGFIVL